MIKSHVLYRLSYGLIEACLELGRNLVGRGAGVKCGRPGFSPLFQPLPCLMPSG